MTENLRAPRKLLPFAVRIVCGSRRSISVAHAASQPKRIKELEIQEHELTRCDERRDSTPERSRFEPYLPPIRWSRARHRWSSSHHITAELENQYCLLSDQARPRRSRR